MASSRAGNILKVGVTADMNNQVKARLPALLLPSITPPISIANTAPKHQQASTPLSLQPTPVNGDSGDNERRGRPIVRSARHELVVSSGSSASSSRSPSPMQLIGKAPSTTMVSEKIIVGVRVRPFIAEDNRHVDADHKQIAVSMKANGAITQVEVKAKPRSFVFQFDHGFTCFNDGAFIDCNQESVYGHLVQPLVASTVAGFNCSFFAYGQTGTGKTFSTFGTKDEPGVLPRFCEELLEQVRASNAEETWKLEVSYLEIYNEIIIDLLNGKDQRHKLRVREHPEDGPFVENLIHETVTNEEEITTLLSTGNLARHKAATSRNDTSSRSHAVFSLKLIQMTNSDGRPVLRKSKASFVDLAGSERFDSMSVSAPNATRLAEERKINKSLTHLALVILQLADGKRTHISYRDSVLTWLLKDSLGGNAKTVMLATVAPSLADVDETLSTLRYAATAYKVYNETYVNEDPAMGLIEQQRNEIEELKAMLSKRDGMVRVAFDDENAVTLKARVEELVQEIREKECQLQRQKELYDSVASQRTEKNSQAVGMNSENSWLPLDKPALIKLSPDALLPESCVHVLDGLSSTIGQSLDCTIPLNASTILDVHCSISWRDDRLVLYPRQDAYIYVNGHRLQNESIDSMELHCGDRLVLGANAEYCFAVFIPNRGEHELYADTRTSYWKAVAEFWMGQCERAISSEKCHMEEGRKRIEQEKQYHVDYQNEMKNKLTFDHQAGIAAKDEELRDLTLALDCAKKQCGRFAEQLESAQQLFNDAKAHNSSVQEQMKQIRVDFEQKLKEKGKTISELRNELEKANGLLRSKHRVMLTVEEVARAGAVRVDDGSEQEADEPTTSEHGKTKSPERKCPVCKLAPSKTKWRRIDDVFHCNKCFMKIRDAKAKQEKLAKKAKK